MITGNPPGRARAVVPSPRKRRAQRAGQNLARHGQVPQIRPRSPAPSPRRVRDPRHTQYRLPDDFNAPVLSG